MKKVVLLGDSIRLIGYGKRTEELLGEEYSVWQPSDNCRFASYTLRMLFDYQNEIKDADVIHWNNGLWDCTDCMGDGAFTDEEVYVATMCRIAKHLLTITPKVIFATTTPTRAENPYTSTEKVMRYNEILVPRLKEMGVKINDLFSTVAQDIPRFIREDDLIHLTDEAIEVCARQVADAIRSV
jgi:hypothetical protein